VIKNEVWQAIPRAAIRKGHRTYCTNRSLRFNGANSYPGSPLIQPVNRCLCLSELMS